uniref:Uncharacterized protein n=1 Tax=Arundo donax TaxID=35708 RepID=A0A0A9HKP1_ARUDO
MRFIVEREHGRYYIMDLYIVALHFQKEAGDQDQMMLMLLPGFQFWTTHTIVIFFVNLVLCLPLRTELIPYISYHG